MRDDVLELCDLRRVFPGFQLGPLSLRLHPGQVYGLLGPNGAGKTTLLDLIALQLKATTGTLSYGGRPIRWGDSGWKARFSYIRERPSFYAELTVAQILELAGRLYPHWDPVLADSLVATFSLRPHQRVGHLSKGTTLKLGIVLSSHIFEDVEEAATEILILRRGRLVFHASTDTLQDSALYRTMAPGTVAASPDLVLRWRRRDTTWLLVRRGSPLDADLRLRLDHVEEQPTSMIAAVYHGTEHTDVD